MYLENIHNTLFLKPHKHTHTLTKTLKCIYEQQFSFSQNYFSESFHLKFKKKNILQLLEWGLIVNMNSVFGHKIF